MTLSNW